MTTPATDTLSNDVEVLDSSERGDGGQRVERVRRGDGWIIVKHYGLKRSPLRTLLREWGHRYLTGKTSQSVAARRATERQTLQLWHDHGFPVPQLVDGGDSIGDSALAMEYIEAHTLEDLLATERRRKLDRNEMLGRYAGEMARRHAVALETGERGLIQVHAATRHVFLRGGEFVHYDFEVVWGPRHDLRRLMSLEIAGFLLSACRPWDEMFPWVVDAFAAGYTDRAQLARVRSDVEVGTIPLLSAFIRFDRWLRPGRSSRKRDVLRQVERRAG